MAPGDDAAIKDRRGIDEQAAPAGESPRRLFVRRPGEAHGPRIVLAAPNLDFIGQRLEKGSILRRHVIGAPIWAQKAKNRLKSGIGNVGEAGPFEMQKPPEHSGLPSFL